MTSVSKVIVGSVFAVGLGVAAMGSAATASAVGFAIDPGQGDGFSVGTASADVPEGSFGVAVSVLKPASVTSKGPGVTSLSVCGTSFTGQADHVTVSHGTC